MAYMVNRNAPMSGLSNLLALRGRMGDTELVHMSKPEINMLRRMGELTVNPRTGLPEAFNLNEIMSGLSGLSTGFKSGKEAMQQLMDFGLNKMAKFEQPMLNQPVMPQQPMQQMSAPMPQQMPQQPPMQPTGGLTAALAAGKQPKSGMFEGQVKGPGDGMDDKIPFKVEGDPKIKNALLSADEYVVAADVVSELGNGSSNAGARKLDRFMKEVREDANGKTTQQKEVDENKLFRELM